MKSLEFVLTLGLVVVSARAQGTVYEQPMAPAGGTLRQSQLWIDPSGQNDLDSDAIAWEDFQLPQDTTVSRLRFFGDTAPSLGFRISFHHQDPNTIAVQPDLFAAGSTPIHQAVYTSFVQTPAGGGLYRFDVVLTTPLTFSANTRYFVSVVGRTPIPFAAWRWAASSTGPNGTFWWSRGAHMYFHLGESRAMALATASGWSVGTPFCFGDGSGTACPCGNTSANGSGCANSTGMGARLVGTGEPLVSADTLLLTASDLPGPGLFFQGTAQQASGAGSALGDGLLCAGGSITRMGVVFPTGNSASYPGGLTPTPIHIAGAPIAAGDVRHYQCWYRDSASFCTSETNNLTPGLTITWGS